MRKIRSLRGYEDPPVPLGLGSGEGFLSTVPRDGVADANEDAAGAWAPRRGSIVLALADGMGGGPGGGEAAATAIGSLDDRLSNRCDGPDLRPAILDAFESANDSILAEGRGSGTTLVVAEVSDGFVRTYHAGDSGALVVGQRGRIRHETIAHSPTGYAVAAGVLEPSDVHEHDERHYLSNCLGSAEMRIEVGPKIALAPRDTILIASDGILDNVRREDLLDAIRKGPLAEGASLVVELARAAIAGEGPIVGHEDDATLMVFRAGMSSTRHGGAA